MRRHVPGSVSFLILYSWVSPNKIFSASPDKASKKFLEKRLGPFWYQELSWEQAEIADQLLDVLLDPKIPRQTRVYIENFLANYDKNRIKNVKKLLHDFGVKPLPNKNQMKYAIKFSRGNDLALLWFLFEMVYCTDEDHEKIRSKFVNY
jgi:hypothetical protein